MDIDRRGSPAKARRCFNAQRKRRISRIDPRAQTVIEGLQPYQRRDRFRESPLWMLGELSNVDKHRDDMVCSIGERRRRFVAKHEAVLLYEAAEDLPQLLGQEFRAAVVALGASDGQQKRLNDASSGLNHFWLEQREFLGEIRKVLAAHREHDALAYVEKLDAVQPLEIIRLAAEFSEHLERLIAVLIDLAGLAAGIPAILNDMKRSLAVKAT